ncbi:hypothetical protein V8E53_015745 [Lactarius tabidus]
MTLRLVASVGALAPGALGDFLSRLPRIGGHREGWRLWSDAPWPSLRRGPLTTIGRPPLPSSREVMCGERCREAFGTCVRVAGSFVSVAGPAVPLGATVLSRRLLAVNPDLSPLGGCRVGQEEGGAGWECQASHITSYREAKYTSSKQTIYNVPGYSGHHLKAGCCSAASPPLSPTDVHRPPTPTVVAGGDVCVAGPAISLGATVLSCRLLAVNPDLSPLGGCRVGQEEGGAGLECKACPPIGPGREVRPRLNQYPVASPPPSPTDDHRPLTLTVAAEICGERRRKPLALTFALLGRD